MAFNKLESEASPHTKHDSTLILNLYLLRNVKQTNKQTNFSCLNQSVVFCYGNLSRLLYLPFDILQGVNRLQISFHFFYFGNIFFMTLHNTSKFISFRKKSIGQNLANQAFGGVGVLFNLKAFEISDDLQTFPLIEP